MRLPTGFVVFDATDPTFYNGLLSSDFDRNSGDGQRPWFFQPDDWVPAEGAEWYGSMTASLFKRLVCYSLGYATKEEAEVAAQDWLTELRERHPHWR